MRIADNMMFEQVRSNVTKNRLDMADLQDKAATQKRVTKPSDDPVAAARVLSSRIDVKNSEQFEKSVGYAKNFLEITDQSLDEIGQHLVRIKELVLGQVNDASANSQSRQVVATEIEQLYSQIIQVGNRKFGDRFIFGGYNTETPPFDPQGDYRGDDGEMMIPIDKSSYIAMNIPGNKVFLGNGLGGDGITHSTKVQAKNLDELIAQQKEEGIEPPPGAPQQQPEVRGPASTVQSLNNNDFSRIENEPQPQRGKGGINLFHMVKKVQVALEANDKVSLQGMIEEVDEGISQVVLARSRAGARASVLDTSIETLRKGQIDSKQLISNLEDVDMFKIVTDINKTESTLQATLQSSGKMVQPSLMDFLR